MIRRMGIGGWRRGGFGAFLPLCLLAALLLCGGSPAALGQELSQEGFYDIDELERLIEVARESGFTQEDIEKITIQDEGREINAWEFLQKMKRMRALEREKARAQSTKIYLTIQGILADLAADKKDDLSTLRDESIYRE